MRFIETLFLLLFLTQLQAQFDIPVFPNLVGDNLLDEVVDEYKPVTVLSYGAARDLMYSTIYNKNGLVSCVYTGHTLSLPLGVDPSTHLYMNGASNGINCEHTYPRSKGSDSGNATADMHHLFPSRIGTNSSRGNLPFGEIEDNQTVTWSYLDQTQNNIPNTNIHSYSERISGRFEPMEEHKGNVARAMFYFFTMYQSSAIDADPDFFESQRETLCDWHYQDPVDTNEWERTNLIAEYQNGLANPFVLDATLATRSFCALVTAIEQVDKPIITIYPNPVIDYVNIASTGKNNLEVIDVFGKVLIKKQFSDSVELDFIGITSGTYFIVLKEKVFRIVKL